MSNRAIKWAWRQSLQPTAKLTLLALADAADENGSSTPSASALAKVCGVSTRTVRRSIRDLAKAGLLHIDGRHRSDGSRASNRYVLALGADDRLSGVPVIDFSGISHEWHDDADANDHGQEHPWPGHPTAGVIVRGPAEPLSRCEGAERREEQIGGGDPVKPVEASPTDRPRKPLAYLRRVIGD